MATEQQLKDALRQAIQNGDEVMAQVFADRIKSGKFSSAAAGDAVKKENDFIPTAENLAATQDVAPQPERSFLEQAKGVGESALAMTTGMFAGAPAYALSAVNQLGNEITSGEFGTQESVNRVRQAAEQGAQSLTYSPRSEAGQEYLQASTEFLQPLEAFTPLAAGVPALSRAARQPKSVRSIIGKPQSVEGEFIPAQNRPDKVAIRAAQSGLESSGLGRMLDIEQSPNKIEIMKRIESGDNSPDLAHLEVTQSATGAAPKLKVDKPSKALISEGFDPGIIQPIKNQNLATLRVMRDMAKTQKEMIKDRAFGVRNRPSDHVGDIFRKRFYSIVNANKSAGKEIDRIAKRVLRGESADLSKIGDSFQSSLDDMRISGHRAGAELDFSQSPIRGIPALQEPIKRIYRQLVNEGGSIDALGLHELKRQLDTEINYGKSERGLSGDAANVLSSLRRSINDQLQIDFPEYAAANKQYSDTIKIIDEVQRISGRQLDLNLESSSKAVGTLMRRMLGNAQSRIPLMNVADLMRDYEPQLGQKRIAGKSSGVENLDVLIMFADELDSNFGAAAKTSLQGDFDKSLMNAIGAIQSQQIDPMAIIGAVASKASKSKDPVKLKLAQYNARMKASESLDSFLLDQARKRQQEANQ